MSKKIFFLSYTLILTFFSYSQESNKLNLGFEENDNNFPKEWNVFGNNDYQVYLDTLNSYSGKYSAVIQNTNIDNGFKALSLKLPYNYQGKTLRLSGYIKTENISDGYAGLWIRIDPEIVFENMSDKGISGTNDWKLYQIDVPLNPEHTEEIYIGGLLIGKGKMWIDNLSITIDGTDINNNDILIYKKKHFAAQLDKEFDNGSKITIPLEKENIINDLDVLGKIWGFLKYFHINVGNGKYNWDYELFRFLPQYLNSKNIQERNKLIFNWINTYSNYNKSFKVEDSPLNNNSIFDWVEKSNLSKDVKNQLYYIYQNRHKDTNYYFSINSDVGNPEFKNENLYSQMTFPDQGFRLLSIYRFWNIIQYFYPYKDIIDNNWNDILKEYLALFLNAENELQYEKSVLNIMTELNDSHFYLWEGNDQINEYRGEYFAPFRVQFINNNLTITDFYNKNLENEINFKKGDIITHINNIPISTLISEKKKYYPSANHNTLLRDLSDDLLRSSDEKLNIWYISNNVAKNSDLNLIHYSNLNIEEYYEDSKCNNSFKIIENNIGYINLSCITLEDIPKIKNQLKDCKGIIIDIRNYPSAFVPFELGSYFLSERTPFVKFSNVDLTNLGTFKYTEPVFIEPDTNPYTGKIAILVNEYTQSQGEYTAMAFHASKNSTIIGSQTAGTDGNVSEIKLPGGLKLWMTGIGVFYPDGKQTQRIGIIPKINVERTLPGIINNKDEVLEKAIQFINNIN